MVKNLVQKLSELPPTTVSKGGSLVKGNRCFQDLVRRPSSQRFPFSIGGLGAGIRWAARFSQWRSVRLRKLGGYPLPERFGAGTQPLGIDSYGIVPSLVAELVFLVSRGFVHHFGNRLGRGKVRLLFATLAS